MEKVYENIKKFRELKSLTRDVIASELGMSLSGYSKVERGEVDLTISKLRKISTILGVSLEQLLNFDSNQVFNFSNNHNVQGVGSQAEVINFYNDEYKDKYIKSLEREINTLHLVIKNQSNNK